MAVPPPSLDDIDEALAWTSARPRGERDQHWHRWANHLLDQRLLKGGTMRRDDLKRVIDAELGGDPELAERLTESIMAALSPRDTRVVEAPEIRGR